jgi:hypothetical protein
MNTSPHIFAHSPFHSFTNLMPHDLGSYESNIKKQQQNQTIMTDMPLQGRTLE